MKYMKQFGIILLISCLSEALKHFIPLPVPASIYGIVILFLALQTGILPLEAVEDAGNFLIQIMPIMFVPAGVGLLKSWGIVKNSVVQYLIVIAVSTVAVMAVSGLVTQWMIRRKGGRDNE